jgi:hypothetical protein
MTRSGRGDRGGSHRRRARGLRRLLAVCWRSPKGEDTRGGPLSGGERSGVEAGRVTALLARFPARGSGVLLLRSNATSPNGVSGGRSAQADLVTLGSSGPAGITEPLITNR